MPVDIEYLREHYGSLSDEALLAIDRDDLVKAAQECYDAEVKKRELDPAAPQDADSEPETYDDTDEAAEIELDPLNPDERPEWLGDAHAVFTEIIRSRSDPTQLAHARDVLRAARIPCYVDTHEIPPEPPPDPYEPPTTEWQLLVPGHLNQLAASTLDRDLFNDEFENTWKAHLQTLSDDELLAMPPESVFCGLFDRIARVNRVYRDEIARRKLKA